MQPIAAQFTFFNVKLEGREGEGGKNLLISASLQVEHLTSNCNSTSQLLRLTSLHTPPPPLRHNSWKTEFLKT